MPLQAQREARRVRDPKCLDDAVRRARFDRESAPSVSMPCQCRELTLSRSRPAIFRSSPPGSSRTSWAGPYCTSSGWDSSSRWSKYPGTSCRRWCKRAAVRDVHFLESAANRQHRQAGGDRPRNQRKRRSVPIWVMQCSRRARRASIVMRFDIRRAAREQQPVADFEQRVQVELGPERRHEHRHRARTCGDGVDVLLADHVEIVLSTQPAIGRNSDDAASETCLIY